MKFRKKPIEIEAVQFTGSVENHLYMAHFTGQECSVEEHNNVLLVEIDTINGPVTAKQGEWIIKGTAGEIYPCRDDIFQQTYEPIEE